MVVLAATCVTTSASAEPRNCERSDLRLRLRLNDREYTVDEPVRMKMIVKNEGPRCTMVWSDGQRYTFYVFEDDKKIWDEDYCRVFTQAIVEEEWERGHREVYRATWRGWKNGPDCKRRHKKAGPGRYEAQGHFMGDGEPRTNRKSFRVTAD